MMVPFSKKHPMKLPEQNNLGGIATATKVKSRMAACSSVSKNRHYQYGFSIIPSCIA